MINTLNILVVEDNPADVKIIAETLAERPYGWPHRYNIKAVDNLAAAMRRINGGHMWDVIILDLQLPDSNEPFVTFERVYQATGAPIIVYSDHTGYELMSDLHSRGAARFYGKSELSGCFSILHRIIDNVVREHRKNGRLRDLQGMIFKELRNLIAECANCHRWRDPTNDQFMTPSDFLERYKINITSGICPTCAEKLYGQYFSEDDNGNPD